MTTNHPGCLSSRRPCVELGSHGFPWIPYRFLLRPMTCQCEANQIFFLLVIGSRLPAAFPSTSSGYLWTVIQIVNHNWPVVALLGFVGWTNYWPKIGITRNYRVWESSGVGTIHRLTGITQRTASDWHLVLVLADVAVTCFGRHHTKLLVEETSDTAFCRGKTFYTSAPKFRSQFNIPVILYLGSSDVSWIRSTRFGVLATWKQNSDEVSAQLYIVARKFFKPTTLWIMNSIDGVLKSMRFRAVKVGLGWNGDPHNFWTPPIWIRMQACIKTVCMYMHTIR